MSSLDRTMKFHFSEEPIDHEVKQVLLQVFQHLRKKDIIPLTKSLAICYQEIRHIFQGIKMPGTLFGKLNGTKLLKN